MHEICKVPSWHFATIPKTDIRHIIFAEKLHAHHSEDEDDDDEDNCKIGESTDSISHDCENVVQTLP